MKKDVPKGCSEDTWLPNTWFLSSRQQSVRLSNTSLSSRVSFQRVAWWVCHLLHAQTASSSLAPRLNFLKLSSFLGLVEKKEHREGESRMSFTTYVDRKQLGLSHTGGPVKAIPALWSDTLYFPCLPTSFQLKESEREL